MIVPYLRSSSYNTWDWCQLKYFLDYCLGYRSPAGKAATKGSIVHKTLEILAKIKYGQQTHKTKTYDDELKKSYYNKNGAFDIDEILNDAFEKYYQETKELSNHKWKLEEDLKECKRWLNKALTYLDGIYNPLKQNIVVAEQYFDIEIKKDWARYDFGNGLSGYLSIKGTIDLFIKLADALYEMIDYKTGAFKNWNTGKPKTADSLERDPQLCLYYYAAHHLFPDINQFIVTIYYINNAGPISLCFDKEHYDLAEYLIRKRFKEIKDSYTPSNIYSPAEFKCTKLCWFYDHNLDNQKVDSYKKSACYTIKQELQQIGLDKVYKKRVLEGAAGYGTGGGRTHEST